MNGEPHYPIAIKRNKATAERVSAVLGLPEGRKWTGVQVEFGHDGTAIATVGFYVTGEQLMELAAIAATSYAPNNEPAGTVGDDMVFET